MNKLLKSIVMALFLGVPCCGTLHGQFEDPVEEEVQEDEASQMKNIFEAIQSLQRENFLKTPLSYSVDDLTKVLSGREFFKLAGKGDAAYLTLEIIGWHNYDLEFKKFNIVRYCTNEIVLFWPVLKPDSNGIYTLHYHYVDSEEKEKWIEAVQAPIIRSHNAIRKQKEIGSSRSDYRVPGKGIILKSDRKMTFIRTTSEGFELNNPIGPISLRRMFFSPAIADMLFKYAEKKSLDGFENNIIEKRWNREFSLKECLSGEHMLFELRMNAEGVDDGYQQKKISL